MKRTPVVGNSIPTNKPIVKNVPGQQRWSFSFQYFKQIEYFGLSGMSATWFVSLIDRLKDLSEMKLDDFAKNHLMKDTLRYHPINWHAKNIPIKKADIDWVDKRYTENDEEYPFIQFQISKALGRVVGFWSEESRQFFIVLLDPKHNIQPSKDYNYNVDDSPIEQCELSSILADIDHIKGLQCSYENCQYKAQLNLIPSKLNRGKLVYFNLEDDYYTYFIEKTKNKSIKQIIELGLLSDDPV